MAQPQMRKPVEYFLDNKKYLHPKFAANYGNWKYHDRPRPGVLHHVSKTGDEVWTVRAGTQRQIECRMRPQQFSADTQFLVIHALIGPACLKNCRGIERLQRHGLGRRGVELQG